MREIKFRGIREKTGEWVYGYLVMREEPFLHDIVSPIGNQSSCTWAIKRGSEGQYTGQYDPTATEFCEGDIIKDHTDYWEVKFFDGAFWIVAIGGNAEPELLCGNDYMEIIGNRYENPELLNEEPTC